MGHVHIYPTVDLYRLFSAYVGEIIFIVLGGISKTTLVSFLFPQQISLDIRGRDNMMAISVVRFRII